MKKCLLIFISAAFLLTSCMTTNGLKKEKTDNGIIKYSDAVTETTKYEHTALASNPDKNKFNLHRGPDAENLNAYILNGQFFLEAGYECKSSELLRLNSIVFISDDSKITYKKTRVLPSDLDTADYSYEELVNPYFSYSSVNNYSYEDFKVMLTTEEVEELSELLEAPNIYVSFVGERGRTDLFKMSKKVKIALRTIIEKYEYLLYGEPEPEPEVEADFSESDLEADAEDSVLEENEGSEETAAEINEEDNTENTAEEDAE